MKEHYHLYFVGALCVAASVMHYLFGGPPDVPRIVIKGFGVMGIFILQCAYIFGRQNREIAELRSMIERLRGPETDLYYEAMKDMQHEKIHNKEEA
jgi:hypothetical protein